MSNEKYKCGEMPCTASCENLCTAQRMNMSEALIDKMAVSNMSASMLHRMTEKRSKGKAGWHDKEKCSAERLNALFHNAVLKGDPIDVANYAMMISQRGETIGPNEVAYARQKLLNDVGDALRTKVGDDIHAQAQQAAALLGRFVKLMDGCFDLPDTHSDHDDLQELKQDIIKLIGD